MLQNKKILIGVTGGIAAYKIPSLVRLLVKQGAEVKVVLTKDAESFVTRQTLSVLSNNTVEVDFFDENSNWNNHVKLGMWADLFVIAPCTANTMAKMATGVCDNLLLATYLSARCQTIIAPAMDLDMYKHPTTIKNIKTLKNNGVHVIPAETGELASGLSGEGRMAEPENIFEFLLNHIKNYSPLAGKKVLVTAGPTYEAIDPVRFIGNRSTGKMGIAIANAFAAKGADVTLVLGPTHLRANKSVKTVLVETGEQMFEACIAAFSSSDIAVLSAAVADYKPTHVANEKIKKKDTSLTLDLTKTKDILAYLGSVKKSQTLIGFALETENLEENAKAKIANKNLDFIVANSLRDEGAGFGTDTNRICIIDKHNKIANFELKTKLELAEDIVNFTQEYLKK